MQNYLFSPKYFLSSLANGCVIWSRMNHVYHPVPSGGAISLPSTMSPVQGSSGFISEGRNLTVLRSPSSTPEMRPEVARSTPSQQHPSYPYVSPPLSVPTHHPGSYAGITMTASNSQNHHSTNARRDGSDSRHPISRPSPIERRWWSSPFTSTILFTTTDSDTFRLKFSYRINSPPPLSFKVVRAT